MHGDTLPRLKVIISESEQGRLITWRVAFFILMCFGLLIFGPLAAYMTYEISTWISAGEIETNRLYAVFLIYGVVALFFVSLRLYLGIGKVFEKHARQYIRCPACSDPIDAENLPMERADVVCSSCDTPLVLSPVLYEFRMSYLEGVSNKVPMRYRNVKSLYALPKDKVTITGEDGVAVVAAVTIDCESCGSTYEQDGSMDMVCPHCGGTTFRPARREQLETAARSISQPLQSVSVLDDGTSTQARNVHISIGGKGKVAMWVLWLPVSFLILIFIGIGLYNTGFQLGRAQRWTIFIVYYAIWVTIFGLYHYMNILKLRRYVKDNIECPLCNSRINQMDLYETSPTVIECFSCGMKIRTEKGVIKTQHSERFYGKLPGVVFSPDRDEYQVDFRMLRTQLSRKGIDIMLTRCPNCGADIKFPEDGLVSNCEYCDAEFSSLELGNTYADVV